MSGEALCRAHGNDTVVLLHGLGRSPLAMSRLAHDLRREGYQVRNLAYPSRQADIRTLADATLAPFSLIAPRTNACMWSPIPSAAFSCANTFTITACPLRWDAW